MNDFLTLGELVKHPNKPEWGVGQIQSVISGKITVNFEEVGKVVIDGSQIELIVVSD